MGKRTVSQKKEDEKINDSIEYSDSESDSESDSGASQKDQDQEDIINVDFDFFDLNPEVDFLGLKTFLQQLLGDDYLKFNLSGLADIILDPKSTNIGSSIKTDGKEGDPLALLALINLKNYKNKAALKTLVDYFVKKTQQKSDFFVLLKKVLSENDGAKVGLVINERIINVPVEVTPPLFKFLLEEVNKQEPDLKYFLIPSKVYKVVESELSDDDSDEEEDKANKKVKKNKKDQIEFDYFHYEDTVLEKNSLKHAVFKYDNKLQETDARRVFNDYGIEPHLSLILIEKGQLEKSVGELENSFPAF